MKKKIIIASATALFAVTTMFNMNLLQGNSVGDVSLDDIAVMAQANDGENNSKGAKSILITQLGTDDICINGKVHHCTIYDVICLGDGELPCTAGTSASCTPTQANCGNA